MKKIVAVVLALVMVLGLATVASAAVDYDLYDNMGNAVSLKVEYDVVDAIPVNALGVGSVEWVELDTADDLAYIDNAFWVECAKPDADYYLTIDGQKGAVLYVKEVANVQYTVAKEMTNLGTACDQLNANAKYDYYYTTDLDGVKTYYKGVKDTAGSAALLVAGELVQVDALGYGVNAHVWQIETIEDHEVTAISCKVCGAVYNVYENKLAAPAGAIKDATYGYIAPAAPAVEAPSTDKVESAQTFDAGIAMYVGMSVMAAAGSAVVLKKKD